MEALKGKKTYFVAVAAAAVAGAAALGWISGDTAQTLWGILGAGGLAALRAGVAKGGKGA